MASAAKQRQMRRYTQGGSLVANVQATSDLGRAVAHGRGKNVSSGGIMWTEQIVNGDFKYFDRTNVQEGEGTGKMPSETNKKKSNLLGTTRPQKIACTLCKRYYSKNNLPFVVSMSTVLRLRRKWGSKEDTKRQNIGSFMYSQTRLCTFCGEICGILASVCSVAILTPQTP